MSLCKKINEVNALGRQNLSDKGVSVSADATTYEIMQSIADIIVGGGSGDIVSYTDIVYNEDNTITLTDTDGYIHTMVCGFTDGKITSVKFDGISIPLVYDGDVLVKVGSISVDVDLVEVSGGGTEELEQLIDESGVLDSTEGSVEEKVEQLIDKASLENTWYKWSEGINQTYNYLFRSMPYESMPKINPINAPKITYWWSYNTILKWIAFYINCENCTDTNRAFLNATALEYINGINAKKSINVTAMFCDCKALHTIGEWQIIDGNKVLVNPLDFSSVTNSTYTSQCFDRCNALTNVSFVEGSIKVSISFPHSSLLSAESVQSIINGLATVTTAQTLTLNSAIVLTDEQKATINAKGWTLAQ